MLIRFGPKAFWVARKFCLILVKEKLYCIGMYKPGIYKLVFISLYIHMDFKTCELHNILKKIVKILEIGLAK